MVKEQSARKTSAGLASYERTKDAECTRFCGWRCLIQMICSTSLIGLAAEADKRMEAALVRNLLKVKGLSVPWKGAALLSVLFAVFVALFAVWPTRQPLSYSAPLEVDGPVSTATLMVQVSQPDSYSISLSYPYLDIDARNARGAEREQAWKFAGGRISKNGDTQESGSPFVFQVRISEVPSGKEILNQHISHPKLTSWGGNTLNANLVQINLRSGNYQVFVSRSGELGAVPRTALQLEFKRTGARK